MNTALNPTADLADNADIFPGSIRALAEHLLLIVFPFVESVKSAVQYLLPAVQRCRSANRVTNPHFG